MKIKRLLFLAFLLFGVLMIASCSKKEEKPNSYKNEELESELVDYYSFGYNSNGYYIKEVKENKKEEASLTVPEGVYCIKASAFSNCKIESLVLPSTVTRIEDRAFYYCRNLVSITLPEGLKYLGVSAFEYCDKLQNVNVPSNIKNISNETFVYCGDLDEITIPEGIETIGVAAFRCSSLDNINFPKSIKKIDQYAFYNTAIQVISYSGTIAEWQEVDVHDEAFTQATTRKVVCTDGNTTVR